MLYTFLVVYNDLIILYYSWCKNKLIMKSLYFFFMLLGFSVFSTGFLMHDKENRDSFDSKKKGTGCVCCLCTFHLWLNFFCQVT